jgi:hypothetical protein
MSQSVADSDIVDEMAPVLRNRCRSGGRVIGEIMLPDTGASAGQPSNRTH